MGCSSVLWHVWPGTKPDPRKTCEDPVLCVQGAEVALSVLCAAMSAPASAVTRRCAATGSGQTPHAACSFLVQASPEHMPCGVSIPGVTLSPSYHVGWLVSFCPCCIGRYLDVSWLPSSLGAAWATCSFCSGSLSFLFRRLNVQSCLRPNSCLVATSLFTLHNSWLSSLPPTLTEM